MKIYCMLVSLLSAANIFAQVAINTSGVLCDSSAILDVTSTAKGLLIPRMTHLQRNTIYRPATGLMTFCIDNGKFYVNQGNRNQVKWMVVADEALVSDSLNACYRRSDTSQVLLSRLRAGHDFESLNNKSSDPNLGTSNQLYPTQNAVKMYVNAMSPNYIANSYALQTAGFHISGNGWIQGYFGIGLSVQPQYLLDIAGANNVLRINTLPVNSVNTSVLVIDDATGVVSKRTGNFTTGTVTAVTASAPLTSSGGTTPNITISQAGISTNGFLSTGDWNLFNSKENLLSFISPLSRSVNSISILPASTAQNGYLSGADYSRLHGTSGSVLFFDASGLQQDNASLFFDNTTNRLGVGTSSPAATLSVGTSSQFQVSSDGRCIVAGAYGASPALSSTNTSGTGISGTGTVYGVYGQSTVGAGERAGGYFYTSANAYARVGGYKQTSPGVYEAYLIWGVGKLVTQNISSDGQALDLIANVSPQSRVTDCGGGRLVAGRCRINFDPALAKRVNSGPGSPIRVMVQPEEDCNGVYVTNKSSAGFDVVELKEGRSNAAFSWFVTADLIQPEVADKGKLPETEVRRSAEYSVQR